jgi:hypothetical protein
MFYFYMKYEDKERRRMNSHNLVLIFFYFIILSNRIRVTPHSFYTHRFVFVYFFLCEIHTTESKRDEAKRWALF